MHAPRTGARKDIWAWRKFSRKTPVCYALASANDSVQGWEAETSRPQNLKMVALVGFRVLGKAFPSHLVVRGGFRV